MSSYYYCAMSCGLELNPAVEDRRLLLVSQPAAVLAIAPLRCALFLCRLLFSNHTNVVTMSSRMSIPCGVMLKDAGRGVEKIPFLAPRKVATGVLERSSVTSYAYMREIKLGEHGFSVFILFLMLTSG